MKKRNKKIVLPCILLGTVVLFSKCGFDRNGGKEASADTVSSIEEVDLSESNDYYVLTNEGERVYLGEVEVNPDIYQILNSRGYHLSNYPDFDIEVLDSYSYEPFENSLGITTTGVNFRTGPSTDYDIIETLESGTNVDLVAKCDNGWYLVQREGTLGFIRGDFLREINDSLIRNVMESLPSVMPIVTATTDVNIRPESNTNQKELGVLRSGSSLEMIQRLNNGWYEVIYHGQTAYVCGDFVREEYAISGDLYQFAVPKATASVYDAPYGSAICSVYPNSVLRVYGVVDGYYYIECDGKVGYISQYDCNLLDNLVVAVNTGNQTVSLHQNGSDTFQTEIVSGKDTSPTDLGVFAVYAKAKDTWLTGADYSAHVNYWMPYNGGEGLHDATWRSSFGGEIYHENGSHGCVNMELSDAAYVYDQVQVGTPVLVYSRNIIR